MMLPAILELGSAAAVSSVDGCVGLLAQTPPAHNVNGGASSRVVTVVGILLALVIVGAVLILMTRRRLLAADSSQDATAGLMENLRHLRDTGQMTPEEYERTRRAMANRVAGRSPRAEVGKTPSPGGGTVTPISDEPIQPPS